MKRLSKIVLVTLFSLLASLVALSAPAFAELNITTNNAWMNDYPTYSSPIKSYLFITTDDTLQRVEFVGGQLVVEDLTDESGQVVSTTIVDPATYSPSDLGDNELLWGGAFSGSDANYVVTGQSNPDESDDVIVVRVTKYGKDWSYISCTEIRAANTLRPFDGGVCVMVEQDGQLYVRTCHTMYKASDGINHQASMLFVIDEQNMSLLENISGLGGYGYVSHSFNQRACLLGSSLFLLDHGDAYPRAIVVNRFGSTGSSSKAEIISFQGEIGANLTGGSFGGFESSETAGTLLAAGNLADQDAFSIDGNYVARNVWVASVPASLDAPTVRQITSYESYGSQTASTPHLVKVDGGRFLLLWNVSEYMSDSYNRMHTSTLNYTFVDAYGNQLSEVFAADAILSDCQPVVWKGKAVWYSSSGPYNSYGYPSFFAIDVQTGEFSAVRAPIAAGTWGTCSWEISVDGTLTVHPGVGASQEDKRESPWSDYSSSITSVVLVEEGGRKVVLPEDSAFLFHRLRRVTSMNLSAADASVVRTMYWMFGECSSLVSLDLSGWDTSSAEDIRWVFTECTSLESLDLSGWDTTSVISTASMVDGCSSLTTIDLSGWETPSLVYTASMFYNCSLLTSLDLSGWDTSDVKTTNGMFLGCSSLESLDLSGWDTSAATDMDFMFYECSSLREITIGPLFDVSGDFPSATADNGKWWSANDGRWYTVSEIVSNRKGIADRYTNYESTPPGLIDISAATISPIPVQTYTGSPITPAVGVRLDGKALVAGTDYTVSYSNNVNVGTATVTVTGKGAYKGTKTATFRIFVPAPTNPFRDVSESTGHYEDILWLADAGISRGWDMGDGTFEFRPYNNVARADMAAFLCRLVNGSGYTYQPTADDVAYFSDVDWSTPHCRDIWWLAHQGISRGWTEKDGSHTFRPYANVARCDMACFLMRMALGSQAEESYVPSSVDLSYFSDVDARTSHRNAVLWLAHEGISAGWTVGSRHEFRPYANVARADMAAFLHRMDSKGLVPEAM